MIQATAAFLILLISLSAIPSQGQPFTTTLTGTVADTGTQNLIAFRHTDDPRTEGIVIPVSNGIFRIELHIDEIQQYALVFEHELRSGTWQPIPFFPQDGVVYFTLSGSALNGINSVSGGLLNERMNAFQREMAELFHTELNELNAQLRQLGRSGNLFLDAYNELIARAHAETDSLARQHLLEHARDQRNERTAYTLEARTLLDELEQVERKQIYWKQEYIRNNADPLAYSLLYDLFRREAREPELIDILALEELFRSYQTRFAEHTYTLLIDEILQARDMLFTGSVFIDITAKTTDGTEVTVSEIMNGQLVLLDFWASWCASCRTTSRRLVPLYEQFGERGFNVIGIAREFGNTQSLERVLEREAYPWTNLVDLDNRYGIWNTYHIQSPGAQYLIDSNGIILAINPSIEELESLLHERLN